MKLSRRPIKNVQQEAGLFRFRAIAGFLLIVVCLVILAARFFYLQILKHEEFSARSDANRIYTRPLAPARGLIYDRNGVLLADNVAAFRLEVIPEQVSDMQHMLQELRNVVPLTDDDIEHFGALYRAKRSFQSVPLRLKLSEEEIARFLVNRWRFPGVDIVPYLTRHYPLGSQFAHQVGYVGRIDVEEQERLNAGRYAATTQMGKSGIERYYEDLLHGEPGYEQVEVNVDRRPLRVLDRVAPKPGQNLYLTIDANLQKVAEAAFEGQAGAAVAIDPQTGEILAMVSVPSFDANLFVNGISRTDYEGLLTAPNRPLFNRALVGGYKPGSTIKPFIGLAGLELGLRRPADTVFSTGEFYIPGQERAYRDWRAGGHGHVDLVQALAQSVNTYFYSVAFDMGIDRMSDYLSQFGFGSATGIDLIGEGKGILPSRAWKTGVYGKPWFPGETVIAGIGQGYWVTTPLQLSNAVALLANQGKRHVPHLLKSTQAGFHTPIVERGVAQMLPVSKSTITFNPKNFDIVREGMIAVVNGPTGTANKVGVNSPYVIAGKTGTAQLYSRNEDNPSDLSGLDERQKHQALFIAYAPVDAPTIALALVLEFGASGAHDAAPMARKILDAYLLKDTAQ